MATTNLPNFPPVNATTDIPVYFERLEQYFIATNVAVQRRVPMLLCVIGEEAYINLLNLCIPGKITDKTLPQIEALLTEFYQPPKSETVYRLTFQRRVQGPKESIQEFIAGLKQLS